MAGVSHLQFQNCNLNKGIYVQEYQEPQGGKDNNTGYNTHG